MSSWVLKRYIIQVGLFLEVSSGRKIKRHIQTVTVYIKLRDQEQKKKGQRRWASFYFPVWREAHIGRSSERGKRGLRVFVCWSRASVLIESWPELDKWAKIQGLVCVRKWHFAGSHRKGGTLLPGNHSKKAMVQVGYLLWGYIHECGPTLWPRVYTGRMVELAIPLTMIIRALFHANKTGAFHLLVARRYTQWRLKLHCFQLFVWSPLRDWRQKKAGLLQPVVLIRPLGLDPPTKQKKGIDWHPYQERRITLSQTQIAV